jgi:hypothetical protein
MVDIIIGDSRPYAVNLTIAGEAFEIPDASTVKAALCTLDRSRALSEIVTLSSSATGADWAESKVVVQFPREAFAAATSANYQGKALLEVQVTLANGDWTWHIQVNLVRGVI